MRSFFLCLTLALVVVRATPLHRRDDYEIVMSQNRELLSETPVNETFRYFHTLWQESVNFEAYDQSLFVDILDPAVRYIWHGKGTCLGLEQVYACLHSERLDHQDEHRTDRVRTAEFQISTISQGSVQVARLYETHRTRTSTDNYRQGGVKETIDLFYLYLRDAHPRPLIYLIERWPTLVDPIKRTV